VQAAIAAQQAGKKPAERPLTARERAMSFAKCIQRPGSTMRLTQSAQVPIWEAEIMSFMALPSKSQLQIVVQQSAWPLQGRLTNAIGGDAEAAAAAGDAVASSGSRLSRAQVQRKNELAQLQQQHEADQRSVAAIAQGLRMHGTTQPASQ
jgi:hypothetical protein